MSRARGTMTKIAAMQRVPTMLMDAAAQGAPIMADNAPTAMLPTNNNTWVMWKIAMARPRN
jgi:hypothetical protein